ncbi:MAG: hypothetical protein H6755_01395 [Candidatus Omnitrophica bacterium]|nr:hypothetical protein [Candidatus Omnitrophota bacterium]
MSGLIGFTTKNLSKEIGLKALTQMRGLIMHCDFYKTDNLFNNDAVFATRCHKGIIQKESQPFKNNGCYIWLEGELYNQEELKEHYGVKSETDLELLVDLYSISNNLDFLITIDGIFTAVLFDSNRGMLYLFNDRFGLQPFYWTVINKSFIWFSELKALLGFPEFKINLDRQAIKEYLRFGFFLNDKTWFKDVRLLSSATVLCFNIRTQELKEKKYWDLRNISINKNIDENAIIDELGRLFLQSVKKRFRVSERIGVTLSGGLDSRAIFAAIPLIDSPLPVVTFGRKGCLDIKIAKQVIKKRSNSKHHIFDINANNWLANRISGVWWSDGQKNIIHMHGITEIARNKELMDITLDGFLGDAILGGSYFNDKNFTIFEKFENRGRRFILLGQKIRGIYLFQRFPFFDKDLMDFVLSIPEHLRQDSYIYNRMLLSKFPEFFKEIAWCKTRVPISWNRYKGKIYRLPFTMRDRILKKINIHIASSQLYTDYLNWLKIDPAKQLVDEILQNPKAIYRDYIKSEDSEILFDSQRYRKISIDKIGLYITLEIWLQQLFHKKYLV